MTKDGYVTKWSRKGKVEMLCLLVLGCAVIPWMIGLVIAAMTVEPFPENFIMIFGLLFYTMVAATPFVITGVVLGVLRGEKEEK